jgi:hypothetical protein
MLRCASMENFPQTIQLLPRAWAEQNGWDAAALRDGDTAPAWRGVVPPLDYALQIDALLAPAAKWDSNVQCWGDGERVSVQLWTRRAEIEDISIQIGDPALLPRVAQLAQLFDAIAFYPETGTFVSL